MYSDRHVLREDREKWQKWSERKQKNPLMTKMKGGDFKSEWKSKAARSHMMDHVKSEGFSEVGDGWSKVKIFVFVCPWVFQ